MEVLIKDAIVFIANDRQNRDGSQYDVTRLKKTFGLFNFECVVWEGTPEDHKREILNLKGDVNYSRRFSEVDAVFVVCMLHADKANKVRRDYINTIANLEQLKGKLTVLIAQCCQGTANIRRQTDGAADADEQSYRIVWFATSNGNTAARDVNAGTPFIQKVCDALENGARNNKHLLKIIDEFTVPLIRNTTEAAQPTYSRSYPEDRIKFYLPPILNDIECNVNKENHYQ